MRRIAVDFDGTLAVEKWPEIGDWLPGAIDALKHLARTYDEVVIHTCRVANRDLDEVTYRNPEDQLELIENMLLDAGIPENVYVWTKGFKPPAEHYVDNRAIQFHGDWPLILFRVAF